MRKTFTLPTPSAWDIIFEWSHLYGLLWEQFAGGPVTVFDLVYKAKPDRLPMADRATLGVPTFSRTLSELVAVTRVNGAEIVLTTFAYSSKWASPTTRSGWCASGSPS